MTNTPTPPLSKCCGTIAQQVVKSDPNWYVCKNPNCPNFSEDCEILPAQPTGDEQPAEQGEWNEAEFDQKFDGLSVEERNVNYAAERGEKWQWVNKQEEVKTYFRQQIAQAVAKEREQVLEEVDAELWNLHNPYSVGKKQHRAFDNALIQLRQQIAKLQKPDSER